jgi:nucleotide-binding universal stress UspA family protein
MKSAYKNVLVAVPPPSHEWYAASADSLRNAAAMLSLVPDVRLTFLSVYSIVEILGDGEVNLLPPEALEAVKKESLKKMADNVGDYVRWFTDNGVSCSVRIEEGTAAEVVVSVAKEINADLVLLGYHHDEGLFDLFRPDVARRVTKHAPCDVMLIATKKIGG